MSKERTNISIDKDLKNRAQEFAEETKRSLSGLIEMGLEKILDEHVTESNASKAGDTD